MASSNFTITEIILFQTLSWNIILILCWSSGCSIKPDKLTMSGNYNACGQLQSVIAAVRWFSRMCKLVWKSAELPNRRANMKMLLHLGSSIFQSQRTEIALNFAVSVLSETGSSVQNSVEMTCSNSWHLAGISNSDSYTVDWVWNSVQYQISVGNWLLYPIFQLRLKTQKGHTKLSPVAPFWVSDWVWMTERLNSGLSHAWVC